jgi:hypothetical protein
MRLVFLRDACDEKKGSEIRERFVRHSMTQAAALNDKEWEDRRKTDARRRRSDA